MAAITIGRRSELSPCMIQSMYEFRRDVFVRRLAWSLPMLDGLECDEYDHVGARYFVASHEDGSIRACTRLLPTTEQCMLPELFPQLLGGTPAPRDASIWELSRFAVSICGSQAGRVLSLSRQSIQLFESVLEFARGNSVTRLSLVTSIALERLMLRAGICAHRIAAPVMLNGMLCIALFIEVPSDRPERVVARRSTGTATGLSSSQ